MKKMFFVVGLALAATAGLSAQSWTNRWEWPLTPIHQQYNPGDASAADGGTGGPGHFWVYYGIGGTGDYNLGLLPRPTLLNGGDYNLTKVSVTVPAGSQTSASPKP